MSDGPTGSASYGSHAVLSDVLHEDRKFKIQSVAGPDVTDQIGASVHLSSMEGTDAFPDANRHITGYATPANFVPDYSKSTTKDAGDLAAEEGRKRADIRHAEEAKKAAEEAEIQAGREKATVRALAEKKARLASAQPESVKEKEENLKAIAAVEKEQSDLAAMMEAKKPEPPIDAGEDKK